MLEPKLKICGLKRLGRIITFVHFARGFRFSSQHLDGKTNRSEQNRNETEDFSFFCFFFFTDWIRFSLPIASAERIWLEWSSRVFCHREKKKKQNWEISEQTPGLAKIRWERCEDGERSHRINQINRRSPAVMLHTPKRSNKQGAPAPETRLPSARVRLPPRPLGGSAAVESSADHVNADKNKLSRPGTASPPTGEPPVQKPPPPRPPPEGSDPPVWSREAPGLPGGTIWDLHLGSRRTSSAASWFGLRISRLFSFDPTCFFEHKGLPGSGFGSAHHRGGVAL